MLNALTVVAMGGEAQCTHVSFVCFGNISDLEKVKFSENSCNLPRFLN